MKFGTTVELGGTTATGFEVPAEIVAGLGTSKKPAVTVTINGTTYRTTVATMDGRFMVPLSAERRTAAGVAAGDAIDVDIELDTAPRGVDVPADFAAALAAEPAAQTFFDGISYSNKRWHVLSIDGAKTAETRQRRIDKSITMLREGRAR